MLAAISRMIFDLTAIPEALVFIAIIEGLVFVTKIPVEPVKVGFELETVEVGFELEPILGMALEDACTNLLELVGSMNEQDMLE